MKNVVILICFLVIGCSNSVKESNSNLVKEEQANIMNLDISEISLEIHDFESIEKYLRISDEKTYVVNFWATWCAPCVKELPYFEKIGKKYRNENVEVILISLDFPQHYDSKLKPFIAERKLKSKIVVLDDADSNSWIPKVNENWSGAIPATLIYNKNKKQFYEQSFNFNELETELKHFLK